MRIILQEFKEEMKVAQMFLNSIQNVDDENTRYMMNASMVLILYNSIESTTSKILTRIHDEIISHHNHEYKYHDFHDCIKTIIYKSNYINQSASKFNFADLATLKMKEFNTNDEYGKKRLNGNVDARRINEIFKEYGISELKCIFRGKLEELKQDRQFLAHGGETFKDYGRNKSIDDIRRYFFATKGTLFNAINNVDSYISQKKFLVSNYSEE